MASKKRKATVDVLWLAADGTRRGPFDPVRTEPCGTDETRRWHVAHGEACRACWPGTGLPALPLAILLMGAS